MFIDLFLTQSNGLVLHLFCELFLNPSQKDKMTVLGVLSCLKTSLNFNLLDLGEFNSTIGFKLFCLKIVTVSFRKSGCFPFIKI